MALPARRERGMTEVINLNQKWHIGDQLGAGGFGRVYLAQSKFGETAVLELIPKVPEAYRELLVEDVDGIPNVVPILDRGDRKDFWVLVMPKADKSLREHLSENIVHIEESLPEIQTSSVLAKVVTFHEDVQGAARQCARFVNEGGDQDRV